MSLDLLTASSMRPCILVAYASAAAATPDCFLFTLISRAVPQLFPGVKSEYHIDCRYYQQTCNSNTWPHRQHPQPQSVLNLNHEHQHSTTPKSPLHENSLEDLKFSTADTKLTSLPTDPKESRRPADSQLHNPISPRSYQRTNINHAQTEEARKPPQKPSANPQHPGRSN